MFSHFPLPHSISPHVLVSAGAIELDESSLHLQLNSVVHDKIVMIVIRKIKLKFNIATLIRGHIAKNAILSHTLDEVCNDPSAEQLKAMETYNVCKI